MSRFEYVCSCGNRIPAERVERRVPGTSGMGRIIPTVVCEKDNLPMHREEAAAKKRETR